MTKKRKPRGFWEDRENVKEELNRVTKKLKHFPTENELVKRKISSLSGAACKHYGGLIALKNLLEEENSPREKEELERLLKGYTE